MGGGNITLDFVTELALVGSFNPSETSTALGRDILLIFSK